MKAMRNLAFLVLAVCALLTTAQQSVRASASCYNNQGYFCDSECTVETSGYDTYYSCLAALEVPCQESVGYCYNDNPEDNYHPFNGYSLFDIQFTPYTQCSALCVLW